MRKKNNQRETMSPGEEENHISRKTTWMLLVGVFLISFSMLAVEIALTRILSVVLLYHYVFLVVALALLGLGVGGIFVHLFRPQIPHGHSRFNTLVLFASLFALSIPFSVILIARIAYLQNFLNNILFYSFLLFIPFFFVGVFLAEVLRMFPDLSSRIYGMDLIGAAVGSLGAVLALNVLGAINTVLLLALVASVAAVLYGITSARINIKGIALPVISLLIVAGLLGANLAGYNLADVAVGTNPVKEISRVLEDSSWQGEVIETRWNAFGRTDLVLFHNKPGIMGIYIDGSAGTPMYQFNGDFDNPDFEIHSLKTEFPGYLPFLPLQEEERNNALIIGPGGGRDILLALMGGVGKITAVEVNRELVDIVKEYAWYNGGIYTDLDNVSVIVDEGRNFLKRQKENYDIIMLTLPVTRTSRSLEGYALTENFLFTTDSINDYMGHLTDEGRLIVVSHNMMDVTRLLSISLTAFEQKGVSNEATMKQIYIVGSERYPVFVLKKTPFESTEMQSIRQSIDELGYDPTLAYLPTIEQSDRAPYIEAIMSVSRGEIDFSDLERGLKEIGFDVSPVTDNSPFFYKIEVGLPQPVAIVLWSSIIMLMLVILVSLIYWKKRSSYRKVRSRSRTGFNKNLLRFIVFFSMLGIGFMLVEISTIQRLILFLGQPVLSLAVLLFSLLVGAGIGSIYSGRFASEKIIKVIAVVSIAIDVML